MGLKSREDHLQTTCRREEGEISGEILLVETYVVWISSAHYLHVVHTSSACHLHIICTSSRSVHVIGTGQQLCIKPTGFLVKLYIN